MIYIRKGKPEDKDYIRISISEDNQVWNTFEIPKNMNDLDKVIQYFTRMRALLYGHQPPTFRHTVVDVTRQPLNADIISYKVCTYSEEVIRVADDVEHISSFKNSMLTRGHTVNFEGRTIKAAGKLIGIICNNCSKIRLNVPGVKSSIYCHCKGEFE